VRGSGTAYLEDEALATKIENGTTTSIQSVITTSDGIFERLLPEVAFEFSDWERGDKGLVIPLTYRSVKETASNAPIEFTLIVGASSF
jgi:hypothetical protein